MGAVTSIASLIEALDAGEVVVIPTDTVYGLAARLDRPDAIQGIFELKGRNEAKALPVLGANRAAFDLVARFDTRAEDLAARFWPGPLTLVLPRAEAFEIDLGGDGAGVAVRVPEHAATRELLAGSGPLAVTSANRSGEEPAQSYEDALAVFPDIPSLDGGAGTGRSSAVLSLLAEPKVLREGAIPASELLS